MSQQFNVPLGEHHALVLRTVAVRDRASVPELLRPVVEEFLNAELDRDADLRTAVQALERARERRQPPPVTALEPRRRRTKADRPEPAS